ncbi:MAG: M48 family metalloprotease [Planctomycetes bacterium]|nr:M48 family metalloprotease [Planctomycetota bacterium]
MFAIAAALAAAAGALASGLFFAPGCRLVESTADTLADATAGTAASGLFRGAARAAESFRDYSLAEEHYIGRAVAAQILSQFDNRIHPNQQLQSYVNLIGQAVLSAPEAQRTLTGYHFIVLEGDPVQAVSAPGGFVFVTEGAIRQAKDEDEIAALLAHEVAHVSLKHGIKAIKSETRKNSLALLAQSAGQIVVEAGKQSGSAQSQQLAELTAVFGDAIQDITGDLLVKGYSRDLEFEADKIAMVYLKSSGYARAALASYLKKIGALGTGGKGGWFETHPSPQERIAELGDLAAATNPGRDLRRGRYGKTLGG